MSREFKYNFGWDLSEEDEMKKALWALSQYRQAFMRLTHNMKMSEVMPEMGTDEQGSDLGFDWLMILEFESRKLLDKHGVQRETEVKDGKPEHTV